MSQTFICARIIFMLLNPNGLDPLWLKFLYCTDGMQAGQDFLFAHAYLRLAPLALALPAFEDWFFFFDLAFFTLAFLADAGVWADC